MKTSRAEMLWEWFRKYRDRAVDASNCPWSIDQVKVLRACYAHGAQGDWDPDAIRKHLVESDGMAPDQADAALQSCIDDGIVTLTQPDEADILPFIKRTKSNPKGD